MTSSSAIMMRKWPGKKMNIRAAQAGYNAAEERKATALQDKFEQCDQTVAFHALGRNAYTTLRACTQFHQCSTKSHHKKLEEARDHDMNVVNDHLDNQEVHKTGDIEEYKKIVARKKERVNKALF